MRYLSLLALVFVNSSGIFAFPSYASLGGLSERQLEKIVPNLPPRVPPLPPPPPSFTGAKLVDDPAHPFIAPKKGDLRGPCPGLNTLANHGYLPRDGVATPAQVIIASQEGFNMESGLARRTTYMAHIMDGNLVTDLISIGDKTKKTGQDPAPPAIVGGLNNHGTFEGDASLTRADDFFGDNHSFNATLFKQLKEFSKKYGNGFYNYTVGAELRRARIQESILTNPTFKLIGLRHITAYVEAAFPANFFVDGRKTGSEKAQLDMATAERFFKDMRFPKGFFRAAEPGGTQGVEVIFGMYPTQPGRNVGGLNTFETDTSLGGFLDGCEFYTKFVNVTVLGLYPNPKGVLRRNLIINLRFLYDAMEFGDSCQEIFPYGRN